jgi:lactoylglutathione lyase
MWHFYSDDLILRTGMGDDHGPYAEFLEGDTSYLSIFDAQQMARALEEEHGSPVPTRPGALAIVLESDDVDEAYQILHERGVTIVHPPTNQSDWGIRVAHVRDPDDNLIGIYTESPKRDP